MGGRIKRNNCLRRKNSVSASLTVEAALGLTLFILFSVCMMMPMEMLRTRQKIQTAMEAEAKSLSRYAYILYRLDQGDETVLESEETWNEPWGGDLTGFLAGTAVKARLAGKIRELVGDGRLENLRISRAEIMEDGENIILRAEYSLKLPFSVFHISRLPASSETVRRAWIGSDGERNTGKGENGAQEIMVYIGSSMGRYHLSRSCHYLSNEFTAVSYEEVKEKRNHSGGRYGPCSVCGKEAGDGSTVYIMPNGSHYHSRTDCSSLVSYVREVPLSEVKYLGACSYCAGGRQ